MTFANKYRKIPNIFDDSEFDLLHEEFTQFENDIYIHI